MKWEVGDVVVTRVQEIEVSMRRDELFANASSEAFEKHRDWLMPDFVDSLGHFKIAIQAFFLETPQSRILVDSCVGNDRDLPAVGFAPLHGTFLEDLAGIGASPESIDIVVCTHLHFDHVGWHTRREGGRWIPTFPNARHLVGRVEYEHSIATESEFVYLEQTLDPVIEAGLHEFVEVDHRVDDAVCLEPSPGHTPGHVSVRISSRGEEAVITGDMVHHPIQLAEPGWQSQADWDPDAAILTRKAFAARYGNTPTRILGTHFAAPTAGYLVRDSDRWRFGQREEKT